MKHKYKYKEIKKSGLKPKFCMKRPIYLNCSKRINKIIDYEQNSDKVWKLKPSIIVSKVETSANNSYWSWMHCSVRALKGLFHEILDKAEILGDTLQLGNVVRKRTSESDRRKGDHSFQDDGNLFTFLTVHVWIFCEVLFRWKAGKVHGTSKKYRLDLLRIFLRAWKGKLPGLRRKKQKGLQFLCWHFGQSCILFMYT